MPFVQTISQSVVELKMASLDLLTLRIPNAPQIRVHLEECRLRGNLSFKALFEFENGTDEVCIVSNLD